MQNKLLKFVLLGMALFALNLQAADDSNNPITSDLPKGLVPTDETEAAEILAIDNLIMVTEKNLEAQRKLKNLLEQYQKMRLASLQNPKNHDQIDALVKKALEIQTLIQNNHLTHVFDPQFLSELDLLSQVAAKPGLPVPNHK